MIASLPYGPPVNTLIIIRLFSDFFVSVAMLVVRHLLEEEACDLKVGRYRQLIKIMKVCEY